MFLLIFNQLLKMLIIMLVAFGCYKLKIVNQEGNRALSSLLLMVVNPCLIITAYQVDYDSRLVKGFLIAFGAACAAHIIAIVIARLLIPEKNNPDYYLDRFGSIYSNCGFIGIPLVHSILGNEGVFYLTAYMAVFNLFSWTHGLSLIKNSFSLKQLKEGLLSPMILATLAAMLLFFTQLRIPATVLDSMNYIAGMNTPLAMMVAGVSVAQSDFKKIFSNLHLYWVSFLKLLVVPLAVALFLYLTGIQHDLAYTTLIAAACPASATMTMMSIRYNRNYVYSSEIYSFTTMFSMITIPIIIFVAGFLIK
ncbi:MAG: AEC family transporter [Muricomes sp.]